MNDPLVEEIVRQVLGELASSRLAVRDRGVDGNGAPKAAEAHASIRENVITENILENALGASANGLKRITVAPDAILTPSARDWLRTKQIVWDRRPGTDSPAADSTWMAVIVHSSGPLQQAVDEAGSQGRQWRKLVTDCPEKAVNTVAAALADNKIAGAAAFTSSPAAVACAMNRRREARSAVVESAACVRRVVGELRANVFCINPEGKSYFELRGLLRAIAASRAERNVPKWIS